MDKNPRDFWGCIQQVLLEYEEMALQNFNGTLGISVFVGQAAPQSWKYFKKHMLGWQGVKLQKIHVLQYSCVMGERKKQRPEQVEEKRKLEKVENLIAVALTGNLEGRNWKRGRPNTSLVDLNQKAERDRGGM